MQPVNTLNDLILKLSFIIITPGNAVDLIRLPNERLSKTKYHGIFFARLLKEKGIFDLIDIWEVIVKKCPKLSSQYVE
jgi:hypothetical protein